MNEEIQFGMGLDTGAFFKGTREVKNLMGDLKQGAGVLGDAIKGALLGFSAAAVINSARGLMQYAKGISEAAEKAGVSTTFLQQWSYAAKKTGEDAETAETSLNKLAVKIGEASTGNKEAISVFQKWGVTLEDANGKALPVQQVAENIAKRLNEIESPAQRAAAAVDLMGRLGVKMVAALKGIEDFKKKSDGKILDEGDIARLESAEKRIESIGGKLKVFGGKLLGAGLTAFGLADPNAFLNKRFKEIDARAGATGDVAPTEIKKTKEFTEALEKLNQAKSAGSGDKLLNLMEEEARLKDHLKDVAGDELEAIKSQTELQLKHNQVLEERKRLSDDYHKKEQEALLKQQAMQNEIDHASLEAAKTTEAAKDARTNRGRLTLEEIYQHHGWFSGTLGQDQNKIYQIKELERQADWNKNRGFYDESDERLSRADKLRGSLSDNIPESDRFPFKSLDERAVETNKHLEDLVKKAAGEGFNVVVQTLPP